LRLGFGVACDMEDREKRAALRALIEHLSEMQQVAKSIGENLRAIQLALASEEARGALRRMGAEVVPLRPND